MIVISGALVAVAFVLLVIGLTTTALGFIYASIAVSAVSCVFLLVGILQRRGEPAAEEPAGPVRDEPAPAVRDAVDPTIVVARPPALEEGPAGQEREDVRGQVLVVAGRPRYHVEGCRYLTGKAADAVDVAEARDEGFTACGVCHPDDALAAGPQLDSRILAAVTPALVAEPTAALVLDPEPVQAAPPARPARVTVPPAGLTRTPAATRGSSKAAPVKAPTRGPSSGAATRAAKPAASTTATSAGRAGAASKTAGKAPVRPAAKAAAASTPAGATAARRGTVVVIPDRGRYHRAECRYVRGATDAQELTKAQAARQGYEACGVCAP